MYPSKNLWYLRGSVRTLSLYDPGTNTEERVELSDYLPLKIINLGIDFLTAVSGLHDHDGYWNDEGGLTSTGQDYFNKIITTFCSGEIHIDYEDEYVHRQLQNI